MAEVAVRRLFPKPRAFEDDPTAVGGAVLHLPPDEASRLIEQGQAFRVVPDGEAITTGPLAAVIRDTLACDGEQMGLQAAVLAYANRWRAPHLLRALPLPRLLRPTDYTGTAFVEPAAGWYGERPYFSGAIADRNAALLLHHLRRRRGQLLADTFDQLRAGGLLATGALPSGGCPVAVPADLWRSSTVAFDLHDTIVAGGVRLFVAVEVAPPQPVQRPASRSTIDRFIAGFDAAMAAEGRRYVTAELVDAAGRALGSVSASQIDAALRCASLAALAGPGRRRTAVVPSAAQIDAAARQAVGNPA